MEDWKRNYLLLYPLTEIVFCWKRFVTLFMATCQKFPSIRVRESRTKHHQYASIWFLNSDIMGKGSHANPLRRSFNCFRKSVLTTTTKDSPGKKRKLCRLTWKTLGKNLWRNLRFLVVLQSFDDNLHGKDFATLFILSSLSGIIITPCFFTSRKQQQWATMWQTERRENNNFVLFYVTIMCPLSLRDLLLLYWSINPFEIFRYL